MTKVRRNKYEELLDLSRRSRPQYIEFIPIPIYQEDEETDSTPVKENPFDPKTLNEFVGQAQAKEILKIIVDSANKEKRLIPNILLTGAYGHGKTTLAKLIAKRHKKKVEVIDGAVAASRVKPDKNKIYIIDEAHNIPAQITDSFNILIDAGKLRIIACTTNPGALPAPFRSRFRTIYLEEYQPRDIAKIVERATKRLNLTVDKSAIDIIANRSKCNPRNALNILDFVREIAVMSPTEGNITVANVLDAMKKLGISDIGLTTVDRKYLELLQYDKPVGLNYISSTLSLDSDTVQEEIEPYLLRLGMIERTPRGRLRVGDSIGIPNLDEVLRRIMENNSEDV
jgi:Holliday junction DNA helicase RuvB